MDIRTATRPQGTVPPKAVVEEKPEPLISDIDEQGNTVTKAYSEYDGDIIIASYMEFLEKNDITKEDINGALETLITTGSMAWHFDLFENVPVIFQVREAWVESYISEIIDKYTSDSTYRLSGIHYNNIVAECNLAASLAQFRDEKYIINDEKDLDSARARVRKLPFVIFNALIRKLAVFDRIVAVCTSDWAVRNFMKPQKEK